MEGWGSPAWRSADARPRARGAGPAGARSTVGGDAPVTPPRPVWPSEGILGPQHPLTAGAASGARRLRWAWPLVVMLGGLAPTAPRSWMAAGRAAEMLHLPSRPAGGPCLGLVPGRARACPSAPARRLPTRARDAPPGPPCSRGPPQERVLPFGPPARGRALGTPARRGPGEVAVFAVMLALAPGPGMGDAPTGAGRSRPEMGPRLPAGGSCLLRAGARRLPPPASWG
jgi:hypothetical protein